MKRLFLVCAVIVAGATGCGESFPEPYDQLGLPTDGMFSAFPQNDGKLGVVGLYRKDVPTEKVIAGWDAALGNKGYKQFCELVHGDGSVNRGYENAADKKRYLFTAGKVGDQTEASLLEVPADVASDDVCPRPGG